MNREELLNNMEMLKEQLRSLVDTAETEKRSLSDEEKTQFEETQRQINEIKIQIENVEAETSKENKKNIKKDMKQSYLRNLAKTVSDIVNNRSLEEYSNVTGNAINLRQDAYSTVEDVDDIQALEYTRIIEPLQNAVIFNKLGLTFINTGSLVKLPSVTAVACSINGETTQLESQKVEFSNKSIVPVRLGAAVGLSNTSIKTVENNVNLLAYALRALRQAEERLINKMLFAPVAVAGTDASVKGLFVDMLADASAGKATWANILGLQTAVKNKNGVITENAVYIMSPDTADKLRSMPTALKTPTYGSRFVLEDGKIGGCVVYETNEVNHYDASNNVDYSYIGFIADPSTIIVQEVSSPDLVVDPYTRAKWNETELVLNDNIGFMHERDALLSCMKIDSSSFTA